MAGLFGFFGKKQDATEQETETPKEAYFLDADDAKTLGNIEYMRTPKTVKRTFPKTAGNGGEFEQVKVISAMDEMNGSSTNGSSMNSSSSFKPETNGSMPVEQPASPSSEEVSDRRRTDTSMDMFRSMARDMKKR
jgi:hypothetical protein